ncbi:Putative beta-lactamase-inhibitor-like, PepSY-like [Pustulibacterium marinum]|uniref:Putative beta-lactamase-inhibitor-like, PepSY-like n=1 Tax=Pustulibacterium marinum TaxID=1224947 RepID=A0A1I7IRV3_9FLAO|nr:PepSY-like domain-containing protein [Pustulibacterium marinum]SFU75662.1 Putative beta-lactamase-inhibitor-like, PepSY-like [Pustulibacterium marinum]
MKKQLLGIGLFIGLLWNVQAQEIPQREVPSVIVNQFHQQFSKASDVEWEMDGKLYSVEFETNWGLDHEVWYAADATMQRHKEDIDVTQLPKAVVSSIEEQFDGYTIDDLERITEGKEVVYKMELKSTHHQDLKVVMNATGKVLLKTID